MAALSPLTEEYVRHALMLIRVANGLNVGASMELDALARGIKKLLAGEDLALLGVRDLRDLIKQADQLIVNTFDALLATQSDAVANLINSESLWALNVAEWTTAPSEQAIQRAISQFTVMGQPLQDQFDLISTRMQNNVAASIRLGAGAGLSDRDIVTSIVGTVTQAGVMRGVYRDVGGVVDAATMAAADSGRRATMKANDVTALQWHAVLDGKACEDCAIRADQVWTIDGEPVGTDIEYMPIPLHNWCRCIYLPLLLSPQDLDEVEAEPATTFNDWFDSLSEAAQADLFGVGRAELWREGTITMADLIDQNGMVLSLAELQAKA